MMMENLRTFRIKILEKIIKIDPGKEKEFWILGFQLLSQNKKGA